MARDTPEVSFVVPSYRSRETIQATLDSIGRQKTARSFETIVMDSTGDDTASWLKNSYPGLKIVELPERTWPGAARNRGSRFCQGHYLAFVDADVVLQPEWLETMIETLNEVPGIGLTGGWVSGRPASPWGRILHWIEFSEFLPGLPSGFRKSLSSSNWLLLRESFLSGPGFDESFAMAEDLIFCHQSGLQAYFEGSCGVVHGGRQRFRQVWRHLGLLGFWSGRYRCTYNVRGSLLNSVPVLSLVLPAYRLVMILLRAFRANPGEGLRVMVHLPLLQAGLVVWAVGFFRGLRSVRRYETRLGKDS